MGPNGAGKTTLIKCLLGITFSDGGEARILGIDVRRAEARRSVGYLPEDHQLPPHLRGERLLDLFAKLYSIRKLERKKRVDRLLDLVELDQRRRSKVKEYSKGMRQRLGIAQALINQPKLLLLDEPNEGLDPLGRKRVKELLLQLKREGVTVFISSHVLTEIERLCDRVAILHEGRLIREGAVEELTAERSLEDAFVEIVLGTDERKISLIPKSEGEANEGPGDR